MSGFALTNCGQGIDGVARMTASLGKNILADRLNWIAEYLECSRD